MKKSEPSFEESYLKTKMLETYNHYFPFEPVKPIKKYLSGVFAGFDKNGKPTFKASVKQNPLRIELKNLDTGTRKIAWQMIC